MLSIWGETNMYIGHTWNYMSRWSVITHENRLQNILPEKTEWHPFQKKNRSNDCAIDRIFIEKKSFGCTFCSLRVRFVFFNFFGSPSDYLSFSDSFFCLLWYAEDIKSTRHSNNNVSYFINLCLIWHWIYYSGFFSSHRFFITSKKLWYNVKVYSIFSFADGGSEVEKAPFLAKPVRLTPAWEANNLPNDELNFKGNNQFS